MALECLGAPGLDLPLASRFNVREMGVARLSHNPCCLSPATESEATEDLVGNTCRFRVAGLPTSVQNCAVGFDAPRLYRAQPNLFAIDDPNHLGPRALGLRSRGDASAGDRRLAILRASIADVQAKKNDLLSQADYTKQIAEAGDQINAAIQQMEQHEEAFANQSRLVSQRLFSAIVSVLACAFVTAIALLYTEYRFLRTELSERRRAEQSALDSQEALRLLSVRLIRAQDEQSRRFSRELHDSLGQYLSLVKMNLSRYLRQVPPNDILSECVQLLDDSIAESRTISYLLHPPMLDDMGFHFAAKWYLEGFSQRSGIEVTASIPEDSDRLPLTAEITLFRVLQECLTNIHRHSGSERADVALSISAGEATLRIRDYGKGIPPDLLRRFFAAGTHVGVGLAGMRERVREQGGHLDIESNGHGTILTVRIPAAIAQAASAGAGANAVRD